MMVSRFVSIAQYSSEFIAQIDSNIGLNLLEHKIHLVTWRYNIRPLFSPFCEL